MQRFLVQALTLLLLGALAPVSGCLLFAGRHWEDVRKTAIEPINSAVHRHLPQDIKAKNLDAVLAAYATDTGTGLPWNQPSAVPGNFD